MNQDINMDEVLKLMSTVEGATEYMITNAEGKERLIQASPSRRARESHQSGPCTSPSWLTTTGLPSARSSITTCDNTTYSSPHAECGR